ncbi:hypothetical protein AB0953_08060 [Streptomyces sp. NPDC046866]|uniref:DUF7144 family membrane protein n=1 Tax=Streptomyces sp. NPDC046866 TaxID=3154921 RepID=UPI003453F996
MTTTPTPAPSSRPGARQEWGSGGITFAGVLMTVMGVFAILEGIVALSKDDVIYQRIGDYIFKFNLSAWGWIHLILGILVLVTGLGLLKGAVWARYTGVFLASLSVIVHFFWLPYQPLWGLVAIAIAVFIIWALCTSWDTATSRI